MKKLIVCLAAAAAALFPAFAQNGKKEGATPWFVGAGAGMNIGFDGSSFVSRETSHIGAGTAGDFYVGKYFNPAIGLRVGYQGFGVSDQYIDYGKLPFHYAHADLIWRAGNVFTPYVHAGYAHIKSGTPAGGVGFMLPIQVSKRISIIPDIKATVLGGKAFAGEGAASVGGNLSATVGLQVRLGRLSGKKKAGASSTERVAIPVDVPAKVDTVVVRDTVVLHDTVVLRDTVKVDVAPEIVAAPLPEKGTVLFLYPADVLTDEALEILDGWVRYLNTNPEAKVSIEGHTCNIGSHASNMELSQRRADAVRKYLVDAGISPSRIVSVKGYGATRPAETNDYPWTRARNRRAVIKVL